MYEHSFEKFDRMIHIDLMQRYHEITRRLATLESSRCLCCLPDKYLSAVPLHNSFKANNNDWCNYEDHNFKMNHRAPKSTTKNPEHIMNINDCVACRKISLEYRGQTLKTKLRNNRFSWKKSSTRDAYKSLYKLQANIPLKETSSYSTKFETQKKRFPCLYCDKSFGKSSHLRDHHRTHSGERPYICSYCEKAFSQFSNLRTHVRIHTGEKPFKCETCKRSFTQRVTLRSHMRTHGNGTRVPIKYKLLKNI